MTFQSPRLRSHDALPRTVFVIGPRSTHSDFVANALADESVSASVNRGQTIEQVDARSQSASVIVIVAGDGFMRSLVALRALRQKNPAIPIVVCVWAGLVTAHQLSEIARSGADCNLWLEAPDATAVLRRQVAALLKNQLSPALMGQCTHPLGGRSLVYVGWCLRNGFKKRTVRATADWFGMAPCTINRELRKSRLPPLQEILSLGRLAHLAAQVDAKLLSFERLADQLQFPSQSAMSRFVRFRTGHTPSDLRALGAQEFILSEYAPNLLYGQDAGSGG